MDSQTQQVEGVIGLTSSVEVLFEGADPMIKEFGLVKTEILAKSNVDRKIHSCYSSGTVTVSLIFSTLISEA